MSKPRERFGRTAAPAANPQRLIELEHRERRAAVARTVFTIAVTWGVIGLVYFALPGNGYSPWREVLRLGVALGLVGAVFVVQTRKVAAAAMPELRAIQTIGIVLPLFLLVFSIVYLSISHGSAASFTQPLDHAGSLYFTITVFATVGFGDITPVSHAARLIVSLQMLLDLVILGVVVRVVFGAARGALDRRNEPG